MPEKRSPLSDSVRNIIVLDTIHGGSEIASALAALGYHADAVDVYRGPCNPDLLKNGHYDLVVAPVHLDPDNRMFRAVGDLPVMTHHEATGLIIGTCRPTPMIEITGSRGKTTTAFAVAHLLAGPGIVHTSCGTYRYPGHELLFRKSITPSSLIGIMKIPDAAKGWLIAEESLGVTGAGDIAIITSEGDYMCAGGKKSALVIKLDSASRSPILIAAPGVHADHPRVVRVGDHIHLEGERCIFDLNGISGRFDNPLLRLTGYAVPLMTAAAAGCMLGISPESLGTFSALPGRLAVTRENGHIIVDNANTGTGQETTIDAARYARVLSGERDLILVTGQETGAVCEGFPPGEVAAAIDAVRPGIVYIVGTRKEYDMIKTLVTADAGSTGILYAPTFEEAKTAATARPGTSPVVLAVKSWR